MDDLIARMEHRGLSSKSIHKYVGTLSALLNFAMTPRRRWATANPSVGIKLPAVPDNDEIRWLDPEEVDALVRGVDAAAASGDADAAAYARIDRALFRAAAMAGLREGELIALRWRDVDWPAARIRVERNCVLGEFDTPKSKRSRRSVPMADEVAGELDRLFKASAQQGDDDLVFDDLGTGGPLDKGGILRRFRTALKAANLDQTHRLHDLRHSFGTRMAAAGVGHVDGPRRLQDDGAVPGLRAQRPRGEPGRGGVRAAAGRRRARPGGVVARS